MGLKQIMTNSTGSTTSNSTVISQKNIYHWGQVSCRYTIYSNMLYCLVDTIQIFKFLNYFLLVLCCS